MQTDSYEISCGCWELKPGPLQQQLLLSATESSLQSQWFGFLRQDLNRHPSLVSNLQSHKLSGVTVIAPVIQVLLGAETSQLHTGGQEASMMMSLSSESLKGQYLLDRETLWPSQGGQLDRAQVLGQDGETEASEGDEGEARTLNTLILGISLWTPSLWGGRFSVRHEAVVRRLARVLGEEEVQEPKSRVSVDPQNCRSNPTAVLTAVGLCPGINCALQKTYWEPNPGAYGCGLIWKQVLCKYRHS